MKQRLFLTLSTVFLVIIVVWGGYWYMSNASADQRAYKEINHPAPPLEIPPLHSKTKAISPEDFKGHVTVVSFFASWCGPCNLNHAFLLELAEAHHVRIYGVNLRDQTHQVQFWLMNNGNPYEAIGADPQGVAASQWGVAGIPQLFVVDKKGFIRFVYAGILSQERIDKVLLPLLRRLERET